MPMLECVESIVPWTMVLASSWQICGGASTSIVLYRSETLYYGIDGSIIGCLSWFLFPSWLIGKLFLVAG